MANPLAENKEILIFPRENFLDGRSRYIRRIQKGRVFSSVVGDDYFTELRIDTRLFPGDPTNTSFSVYGSFQTRVRIDWGDGNIIDYAEEWTHSHNYAAPGAYTVKIRQRDDIDPLNNFVLRRGVDADSEAMITAVYLDGYYGLTP